jgi:hypothetical protein
MPYCLLNETELKYNWNNFFKKNQNFFIEFIHARLTLSKFNYLIIYYYLPEDPAFSTGGAHFSKANFD